MRTIEAQLLQSLVESAGIRAIVTARAKNPSRLEAKSRQGEKAHDSVEEIYNDLAGARLALHFPGDRAEVDKLIRANFDLIQDPREFPLAKAPTHKKRFSGYWATHYRVRIPGKRAARASETI
jgi:ppGpp synthetase/RelA/SpoT-type nucleotidyltranferase